MAETAILSIHDAMVTFGGKPLFEDLSLNIHEGNKICLVGKNGAGKTTLMHMITGTKELDGGKRWQMPGIKIGYLQQEIHPNPEQTVFDYILSGLAEDQQADEYSYMVEMMLEPFELKAEDKMGMLSGGQLRRAALANSLVSEPDILLLDEPTNHLDLGAIEWLEDFLRAYRGTLLCISHDKAFLSNITNKIFWLDRGHIRVCPKGFAHFDEWSQMLLDQEAREIAKREKLVAQEVAWASTGVKARRKRNVRRVEQMKEAREKLKADRSSYRRVVSKIELEPPKSEEISKVVAEFFNVAKSFDDGDSKKTILEKFNFRIMKGDRIGILGKNGSGKTTFLKLLIGSLKPDMGKIKRAHNMNISYFDQKRSELDPTNTLWETLCPDNGEYVDVGGKPRHVCGYLKDFLFDPKHAKDLVSTLSGGQRNRLMLAKVLANPGNFLILDEPTNDLDMDTLEMLEDVIASYDGTLFIVSHDRDFLDQTVSQIIAFEGQGEVQSCIGGYSDYLEMIGKADPRKTKKQAVKAEEKPKEEKQNKKGLTYNLQREFDALPEKISKLEKEIQELHHIIAEPDLYTKDPEKFDKASRRIGKAQDELETSELRWLELEEIQ